MAAKLLMELVLGEETGAAIAARLPSADAPHLAANVLSALLTGTAAGVTRGRLRVGVDDSVGVAASGTATCVAVSATAGDKLLLDDVIFTCVESDADPEAGEYSLETGNTEMAESLALAINTYHASKGRWSAVAASGTVTITERVPGPGGNATKLRKEVTTGAAHVLSGSTLSGGVAPGATRERTCTITHANFGTGTAAAREFDVDLSDISAGDTITVTAPDGTVYTLTCVASGASAAAGEFNEGSNDTTGATEIAAAINGLAGLTDLVTATVTNTDNVTITANVAGAAGNSIVVTDVGENEGFENGGNPSSALTGGADPTDTLTIGGVTLQWIRTLADTEYTENDVAIGANAPADAEALAAAINAHSVLGGLVSASADTGVVTLTLLVGGRVGKLVTMSESGTSMALSSTDFGPATTDTEAAAVVEYNLGAP